MRLPTVLATLVVGSTLAAAQPADRPTEPPPPPPEDPYPPEDAPPPTEPPPAPKPAPAPVVTAPPGAPITITITNNNNGNNSNTNTQTTTAPVTVSTPVDVSTPVTVSTPITVTAPSTTPPVAPPIASDTSRGRHPTIERIQLLPAKRDVPAWLAIGVTGGEGGAGVRAQIDLLRRGRFAIGVAATASAPHGHGHGGHGGHGDLAGRGGDATTSAVAFLAYTRLIGRLEVRAQAGVGAQLDRGDDASRDASRDADAIARTVGGNETTPTSTRPRVAPRGEAALLVALPLTRRLGLVAGPILSATRDARGGMFDDAAGGDGRRGHPDIDARFMTGLRLGF